MNNERVNNNNNDCNASSNIHVIKKPINRQYSNNIALQNVIEEANPLFRNRRNISGSRGSKNNNLYYEQEKPNHNFGHDVNLGPYQDKKSNGTNLQGTIYHHDNDDRNGGGGLCTNNTWQRHLNSDRKNRPRSLEATSATYTTLDQGEGGREEGDYLTRDNNVVHDNQCKHENQPSAAEQHHQLLLPLK